ncbi:hypothetical protein [Mesorhizobium hawassense]|nr:hypothetical protein [Mesorhizobium hawassense]
MAIFAMVMAMIGSATIAMRADDDDADDDQQTVINLRRREDLRACL